METSLPLLIIGLLALWIFRKPVTIWSQTAEDKSQVVAMKVSLNNRKDESEIVSDAKDLLQSGYTGIDKDMEAFILHGKPMPIAPTQQEAS